MRDRNYYNKRAKETIEEIDYLTLGTVSRDGEPWNTPLAYSLELYSGQFYFVSPKTTQHSKNIRDNGKGFVVVYDSKAPDGEGEAVYFTCTVRELTVESEIQHAL